MGSSPTVATMSYPYRKKLIDLLNDLSKNWDHDFDAHKYGTECRVCEAEKILKEIEGHEKSARSSFKDWCKEKGQFP